MNKIRIGVVGCGGIANGKHLPAEKRNPASELVAFCDIIEERAVRAKEKYGTEDSAVYTDYKEMLKTRASMRFSSARPTARIAKSRLRLWMQASTFCAKSRWQ